MLFSRDHWSSNHYCQTTCPKEPLPQQLIGRLQLVLTRAESSFSTMRTQMATEPPTGLTHALAGLWWNRIVETLVAQGRSICTAIRPL